MFRLQRNLLFGICGVGIPAAIQNLLNVTGMTILNKIYFCLQGCCGGYGHSAEGEYGADEYLSGVVSGRYAADQL